MREKNKHIPGPDLYNSLRHTKKFAFKKISNFSTRRNQSVKWRWYGKYENFLDIVAEKKVTLCWFMNSYMVKTEKYDHVHLVSHFTVLVRPTTIWHKT